jgi:ribosomal protein L37E
MGKSAEHFESETCSRCGGTGRYSFNGQHSICYKCGGAKVTLTKAGREARAKWIMANVDEIPVADLRVGDIIRTGKVTEAELMNGGGGRDVLAKVTEIEVGDFGRGKTGDEEWVTFTHAVKTTADKSRLICRATDTVRRWTLRVELPPVMPMCTPRRPEMKAFVAGIAR